MLAETTPSGAVARLILPNALACALAVLAAGVTTGSRGRRAVGLLLGVAVLLPAWLLPPGLPLYRAVSALLAFSWTMRIVDLARGRWTLRDRLIHVASIVDTRRLAAAPPRLRAHELVRGLGWSCLAVLAYVGLGASPPTLWPARWGAALILAYSAVAAGYALGRVLYAAFGFETGPLHVSPVLSRSVQELWGERWARLVSVWLRETFFRPLARRRHLVLGALLAFAVSAGFHAYGVWVALGFTEGLAMAGWMLAYFLVQAVVVGLERLLGVRRWAPLAGHVWTLAWMVATAPLFLEPAVRVLGR